MNKPHKPGLLTPSATEKELFPEEHTAFITDVLKDALKGKASIAPESRRYHVIESIVAENHSALNLLDERKAIIDKELRGYRKMSKTVHSQLGPLGYKITSGSKHYTATYCGDERYRIRMPASGSDNRGGKNLIFEFIRRTH